MPNKRIYFAIQQVGLKNDGDAGAFTAIKGAQSVGITTNFNLVQVFELGQLAIYENIEEIPDIEVTMSKVLDGDELIYHRATAGTTTTTPTLAGRSNSKSLFGMSIFDDTTEAAEGTPLSIVQCSGMFVSSLSYNFPLDDNFTEDVTLVGNDKVWANAPSYGETLASLPTPVFDGQFSTTSDDSPAAAGGVDRRENMLFDPDGSVASDITILPLEIPGISTTGTNLKGNGQDFNAHLSRISVSADLGRTNLNELGRKAPYHRTVDFPVEVTCEIEMTTISGDFVSATEDGIFTTGTVCAAGGNLKDRTIRVAICEGTRIFLGGKNKLASVNYGGGDAGGGNATATYTYTTFNDFTVLKENDPHASGSAWWADRATYLT